MFAIIMDVCQKYTFFIIGYFIVIYNFNKLIVFYPWKHEG